MWSPLRFFAWVSVAVLPALLPTASVQGAEPEALVAVVPSIKSIESVNPVELQVEWAWIVKEKPENDWTVFFHLRKSGVESDQGFSAGDYKPNLPTSSWPRGKTVTEFRRASIPADLSGKFDVLVGLYQEEGDNARSWTAPWTLTNAFLPANWRSRMAALILPRPDSQPNAAGPG